MVRTVTPVMPNGSRTGRTTVVIVRQATRVQTGAMTRPFISVIMTVSIVFIRTLTVVFPCAWTPWQTNVVGIDRNSVISIVTSEFYGLVNTRGIKLSIDMTVVVVGLHVKLVTR